jgi:hypothetical protein
MTPEELLKLRRDLAAIRTRIEELRDAINEHSKATHAAEERKRNEDSSRKPIYTVVAYDQQTIRDTQTENDRQYAVQNSICYATWFAFGAAFIYATISLLIWSQMRKQTVTIAKQFDQGMRPWVKAELTPGPITFDEMGAKISVTIKLTNVGHSPALNTYVPRPKIFNQAAIANPHLIQTELCAPYEKPDPLNDSLGQIIFAGDAVLAPSFGDLRIESKDDTVRPWVVGCVSYKIGYSGQFGQTDFYYYFQTQSGGAIIRGKDYPLGSIKAVPGTYEGNGAK